MAKKCPHCGGSGYADGGEIPDVELGEKRETETGVEVSDPGYQLNVYRGENAKAKAAAEKAQRDAEFAAALKRKRARGM